MTIAALTGHRPPKAGLTYSHDADGDWIAVDTVRAFIKNHHISTLIVGGALGFDTLGARAAWLEDIPYDVYVPFEGQESHWPSPAQKRYCEMLKHARQITTVSPGGYAAQKMQTRNIAMIDKADLLATWWNGSSSGSRNAIQYAESKDLKIIHLYPGPTS